MLTVIDPRLTIVQHLPKNAIGAEIGVFAGDFSEILLRRAIPSKLHLVDPWISVPDEAYRDALYSGNRLDQAGMDQLHQSVVNRFRKEIEVETVVIHRERSEEALKALPDGQLDWIYLDGDHTFPVVLSDLRLAREKVRRGGYISGDDYGIGGWWGNGINNALHCFLAECEGRVLLDVVVGSQFLLRRL